MGFLETMTNVAVMVLFAVPSYILTKMRLIKESAAADFSVVLLFCCQPCLMFYSVTKIPFETQTALNMLLSAGISLALQALAAIIMLLVLKNRIKDPVYRVYLLASTFGNVGFFGVPLVELMLPDMPEAVAYTSMVMLTMNLLAWTLGVYIIKRDKTYLKLKKAVLNPSTISMLISLPFFFFGLKLPTPIGNAVSLVSKACMPLSMTVLGIRLATMNAREVFSDLRAYEFSLIKLVAFPLFCFAAMYFLPISATLKAAIFIVSCTPSANVCLSFAEIYNVGQKPAANVVLLSTFMCIVSVPLMMLLLSV